MYREGTYSSEERVQQLGRIGNHRLVVLVDRVDGKDGVLANEGMSVFLLPSALPITPGRLPVVAAQDEYWMTTDQA